MLDDPLQERPSPQNVRNGIVEDLQAVFAHDQFVEMAERTPVIAKWIYVNKVTQKELSKDSE